MEIVDITQPVDYLGRENTGVEIQFHTEDQSILRIDKLHDEYATGWPTDFSIDDFSEILFDDTNIQPNSDAEISYKPPGKPQEKGVVIPIGTFTLYINDKSNVDFIAVESNPISDEGYEVSWARNHYGIENMNKMSIHSYDFDAQPLMDYFIDSSIARGSDETEIDGMLNRAKSYIEDSNHSEARI